jgi:hypothetical protein
VSQVDDARDGGFGKDHVVERFVARDHRVAAAHLGVQQLASADAMLAAEGALQFGIQFVDGDGGEETEAAQIHGEQGDLAVADGAGGGEQRAVAAQHDHQIAAFGHFRARETVAPRGVDGGAFVVAHTDSAGFEPGQQPGYHIGRGGNGGLGDDAYGFNGHVDLVLVAHASACSGELQFAVLSAEADSSTH